MSDPDHPTRSSGPANDPAREEGGHPAQPPPAKTVKLKVWRGQPGRQYWEIFELPLKPGMNIISALMEIRRNPVNIHGDKVAPIVWEDGCLEEVCGSCSMLINGYPRQACSCQINTVIEETGSNEITLAPFTKFPLVKDLIVDRTIMFENLKQVHGWVDAEGTWDRGPGPQISQAKQEIMYVLSTCMTCGCCSEGCPNMGPSSPFMGPAAISQVRLYNLHPTGKLQQKERLKEMMKEGGVNACGQAQNCVEVCPKDIPLTDSIAAVYRDVTKQAFRNIFSLPDREG